MIINMRLLTSCYFPCWCSLLSLLSTPPPLSMLGSMFGVDSDMSLRQLVAGSPWAGALAILGARSIRINSIGGSLPRRDFGANQLKTISRSTPSNAFLRNAVDPVLSAPVCLTPNTTGAHANPTRPPRAWISLEWTAHQVGRQQEPAQSQLGDRDSRRTLPGTLRSSLSCLPKLLLSGRCLAVRWFPLGPWRVF